MLKRRSLRLLSALLCTALASPLFGWQLSYKDEGFAQSEQESLAKILEQGAGASLEGKSADAVWEALQADRDLLLRALKARGYYAAKVDAQLSDSNDAQSKLIVDPGARYTLSKLTLVSDVDWIDNSHLSDLPIETGQPLVADAVLASLESLQQRLREIPGLSLLDLSYKVRLDDEDSSGDLVFTVEDAKRARFGGVRFDGLESINETWLRAMIPWQEGDLYSPSKLQALRSNYIELALFDAVDIQAATPEVDLAPVELNVRLDERLHRSIKAGAWAASDETLGLRFAWEHRNIDAKGGRLRLGSEGSVLWQRLNAEYLRRPRTPSSFGMSVEGLLEREDLEAYTSLSAEARATWSKKLGKLWSVSFGPRCDASQVKSATSNTTHLILLAFGRVQRDSRDNALDPTRGSILGIECAPAIDVLDSDLIFVRSEVGASAYCALTRSSAPAVLATRCLLSTIIGPSLHRLPRNYRLYTGGPGSIRGYGYRTGSALSDDEPIGGKSLFEASLELRFRLWREIGAVLFTDAGYAFQDSLPFAKGSPLVAVGTGARYFTSFGPIRLDVAFPVTGRPSDDRWKLYISIGQAF